MNVKPFLLGFSVCSIGLICILGFLHMIFFYMLKDHQYIMPIIALPLCVLWGAWCGWNAENFTWEQSND